MHHRHLVRLGDGVDWEVFKILFSSNLCHKECNHGVTGVMDVIAKVHVSG